VFAALFLALFPALSCVSDGGESTGGETHFLARCDESSSVCGDALTCLCGVCTLPCDEQNACDALPGAACRVSEATECAAARCDVECTTDGDCAVVSESHRCDAGACRLGIQPPPGAGGQGGDGGGGQAGQAGAGSASECSAGEVADTELVVLGDSFFATSHQITDELESVAREKGVLAADVEYRDYSNLTVNGLDNGGIESQYEVAVTEGEIGLIVMNGGGADVLAATCETAESCPALTAAVAALEELFRTMADGGVRQVVYAFYPDPVDTTIKARMDVLRPLVQTACTESPVPCLWLDLRDTFAGNYAEYVMADGLNPTDAGSRAAAEAIWSAIGPCVTP
jgi:hypothetical protein